MRESWRAKNRAHFDRYYERSQPRWTGWLWTLWCMVTAPRWYQ